MLWYLVSLGRPEGQEVTLRRLLSALFVFVVLLSLSACTSDGCGPGIPPPPNMVLRPPVSFEREPVTVPGERMRVRYVPVTEAPSWTSIQSNACAPAFTTPSNPCMGGGGTGAPESIPAVRSR